MGIPFDKDDTSGGLPPVKEPIMVTIGQCEEKVSGNNNDMIVLEVVVDDDQPGAGYKTKFYLVQGRMFNFNCKRIMESCRMDMDAVDEVDDMTFRGSRATVEFKTEKWDDDDGNEHASVKIAKWLVVDPNEMLLIEKERGTVNESAQKVQEPVTEPTGPDYSDDIPFS